MEVGDELHAPVALPREKSPVPIEEKVRWVPEQV